MSEPRSSGATVMIALAAFAVCAGAVAMMVATGPAEPAPEVAAAPAPRAPSAVPEPVADIDRLDDREADLLGGLLKAAFTTVERTDHADDPQFAERTRLQQRYNAVVLAMQKVRRMGFQGDQAYAEARDLLLADQQGEAIEVLDLYLKLQEELDRIDSTDMDLRALTEARWEARRRVFGEEQASMLFNRDEAVERYELDRVALEQDAELDETEKARRLDERKKSLQVELAKQGSYVSFPGERRAEVEAELRDRFGDELDSFTPERRKAEMQAIYYEALPPEVQAQVDQIREIRASKGAAMAAFRQERDAIMGDSSLDRDTKYEKVAELKAKYGIGTGGGGTVL